MATMIMGYDGKLQTSCSESDLCLNKRNNLKGRTIKHYKLIEKLGQGGGGEVFLAYDPHLKRQVVIKKSYHLTRHELEIMLKLKNEYIPNVYDIIENWWDLDGKIIHDLAGNSHYVKPAYLVIEYIKGWNLNRILRHRVIPNKKVLNYAIQLCNAVEYLHRQSPIIIHGDIKPSNIIISKSDKLFLIDFNCAYAFTQNVTPIGYSKLYAAPEVKAWANKECPTYNPIQADIYSIGAVLFEMITGCRLHDVNHGQQFECNEECYSDSLLTAIIKAVEEIPENRFKSVSAMKKSLLSEDIKMYEYDIALSFAGEDREYVEKVARCLVKKNLHVFYDIYEQANLWGKDLYTHLADVYQNKAKYCIIFISKHYKTKLWTNHEMKSAFARAFQSSVEYILPARFDDTEIVGISSTIGYIDLKHTSPGMLADLAYKKIQSSQNL